MSTFYICHCGNTKDHHNFRHRFEKTVCVKHTILDGCDKFEMDIQKFPVRIGTKCAVPQCSLIAGLHGTRVLEHEFQPIEYSYHDAKFTVPKATKCSYIINKYTVEESKTGCATTIEKLGKCMLSLEKHTEMSQLHPFTTKIVFKHKTDNDKITVVDPEDDDIKIVWNK